MKQKHPTRMILLFALALLFAAGVGPVRAQEGTPPVTPAGTPAGTPAPGQEGTPPAGTLPATPEATPGSQVSNLAWTPPRPVPGYYEDAFAPYLIADQEHTIHAFNSTLQGNLLVIVYSRWTEDTGWTTPVDVLLSPIKREARLQGVVLDEAGWVHLVFFGGDDLGASIFYSRAPLRNASNAQAWTKPALIGDEAIAPSGAALATGGQGNLYMIYHGERDGVGLFANYSTDGGATWQEPVTIFKVEDDEHWPTALQLYMDEETEARPRILHAVWTLVGRSGNGEEVYYSHLDPVTHTWTDPQILAEKNEGDYEADWPSLTSFNGRLILVYQDSFPATRWMRTSEDGGLSWSQPVLPFNYVGEYRQAAFVKDSAGNLHMFLGNRTEDAVHGMWHSLWTGNGWSDLIPVIAGPRITDGPLEQRFDPTGPVAAVSNGNLVLVTWFTDPGAGRNGVWYSYAHLDTPELPAQPLPTPVFVPTTTAFPDFDAAQEPERTPAAGLIDTGSLPDQEETNPALIFLVALVPTLALLAGVIWTEKRRLKSRD